MPLLNARSPDRRCWWRSCSPLPVELICNIGRSRLPRSIRGRPLCPVSADGPGIGCGIAGAGLVKASGAFGSARLSRLASYPLDDPQPAAVPCAAKMMPVRRCRNVGKRSAIESGRGLLGQLLQAPEHDDDGAIGWIMTHDAPPGLGTAHRSARRWPAAPWPDSAPAEPSMAGHCAGMASAHFRDCPTRDLS